MNALIIKLTPSLLGEDDADEDEETDERDILRERFLVSGGGNNGDGLADRLGFLLGSTKPSEYLFLTDLA